MEFLSYLNNYQLFYTSQQQAHTKIIRYIHSTQPQSYMSTRRGLCYGSRVWLNALIDTVNEWLNKINTPDPLPRAGASNRTTLHVYI